uniref:Uncharacterized protein n=1 Tax=Molossus molossus TaxID=27622 RepID=A0A7J8BYF5_MOLMO|nr:hypothetical protein HJG59_010040 [Molossus molossus]
MFLSLSLSLPPSLKSIKKTTTTTKKKHALSALAQWFERQPVDQSLIPVKGTYLGCSCPQPWLGHVGGSPTMCPFRIDISLSLCVSLSLSLSRSLFFALTPTLSEQKMEKMSSGEDKKKKIGMKGNPRN